MTAPPDPVEAAALREQAEHGRPPHGASDGKQGGQRGGGAPGVGNFARDQGAGDNAQTGEPAAAEDERLAPGISTDKKADDTR